MKDKKKIIIFVILFFILIFVFYIAISTFIYLNDQKKSVSMIETCKNADATYVMGEDTYNDPLGCYANMFNLLLPKLLIYKVKLIDDKPLDFVFLDNESYYFVPKFAIKDTESMISYGIGRTCKFEDNYQSLFDKNVYSYDCGNKTNLCKVASFDFQCVTTGKSALTYKSAKEFTRPEVLDANVHNFKDKVKELGLEKKPLIVKLNIVGAEDKVVPELMENSDDIAVILIYLHYKNPKMMIRKFNTLDKLNEKFVLVAKSTVRAGKYATPLTFPAFSDKYAKGYYSRNITLTYINKNLIKSKYLPFNQNDKVEFIDLRYGSKDDIYLLDDKSLKKATFNEYNTTIKWVVVFAEKLRQLFGISYE